VHLIYIDDSRDPQACVFSALAVPIERWREVFLRIKEWRRELRKDYGIYVHKELHAWKFVSGRGRPSDQLLTKWRRSEIFRAGLGLLAELPEVRLFNAVFTWKQDELACERLLNRINRRLQAWDSHGILFCDEGKEAPYTRLVRRMSVYNPIPGSFGRWVDSGKEYRNIPIDRIVEDPVFKKSDQSYFIQLVDFAAYALLRREWPLESKVKYGIHKAFSILSPILVRKATRYDPDGIIRR